MNNILLSSHGTYGAQAAERMALKLCNKNSYMLHLLVVPEFWKHMMGDDWLNNGITRDRYARYLESELGRELDEHIDRVRKQAQVIGMTYNSEIVVGEPDICLSEYCRHGNYDLVVVGSPRPKEKSGLRSRMTTDNTLKSITIPLLIAPYPDE
ncbi:MAG: universal stress protein [Gammaproteobacteria bacterium]|nr:universal stress protein [Gammaproteobacteria bacterium]